MVARKITPIISLLVSFMILCFGHGLQSVLLPARATLEQFSAITTGAMMSSYYAGFIIGTFLCPWLISRVGHIRVFAAGAAVASAIMLLHVLFIHPLTWIFLRIIYGLSLVHLYTVMESWLSTIVESGDRGRILSIYMIINFISMAVGQLLFFLKPVESFELFVIASVMLSLSLLPVILSVIIQPMPVKSPNTLSLKRLFTLSPLGVVGAFTAGLIGSAYWGLTARFVLKAGYSQEEVALFMSASFIGGLAAQWPLGMASDRIGRRVVIVTASFMIALSSALLVALTIWYEPSREYGCVPLLMLGILFGAGLHPLYSLCIAHTNDHLGPKHFVRASSGLQFVQSSGAIAGPMLASLGMYLAGYQALFVYVTVLAAGLGLYGLHRMSKELRIQQMKPFRMFTRLGIAALRLDPRSK
jgi:MFS family permease